MGRSRGELTRWWAGFLLAWCVGALVSLQLKFFACDAENVESQDGSAQELYCASISDYFNWGEPSEWTTPVPWISPVAALAAVGGYGVWRRSKSVLWLAAVVATAALVLHVILLMALPG